MNDETLRELERSVIAGDIDSAQAFWSALLSAGNLKCVAASTVLLAQLGDPPTRQVGSATVPSWPKRPPTTPLWTEEQEGRFKVGVRGAWIWNKSKRCYPGSIKIELIVQIRSGTEAAWLSRDVRTGWTPKALLNACDKLFLEAGGNYSKKLELVERLEKHDIERRREERDLAAAAIDVYGTQAAEVLGFGFVVGSSGVVKGHCVASRTTWRRDYEPQAQDPPYDVAEDEGRLFVAEFDMVAEGYESKLFHVGNAVLFATPSVHDHLYVSTIHAAFPEIAAHGGTFHSDMLIGRVMNLRVRWTKRGFRVAAVTPITDEAERERIASASRGARLKRTKDPRGFLRNFC